jgi:hypothetical protein
MKTWLYISLSLFVPSAVWIVALCVMNLRNPDIKINFKLLSWLIAVFVISYSASRILLAIMNKCPH